MADEHSSLPAETEKPSLLDYLDSFLPFRIPRLPFARTAANLDKAAARLIMAKTEQRVAQIDALTAEIKRRSTVEGRFLEAAGRIADRGLKSGQIPAEFAFAYLEAETKIKLSNRAKTLEEAVKQLTFDPPQKDSSASIDDDWLNMFARLAEDKSSEELQSLFGKILAGEIREPGSINLRTLTVVSALTSAEANRIVDLYKFVIDQSWIASVNNITGPNIASAVLLGEMGIITGIGGVLFATTTIPPHDQISLFGTKTGVRISNVTDAELEFSLGVYPLTEAGKQLYKIAQTEETPVAYLRGVAKAIASGESSLKLGVTTLRGKAEIAIISTKDDSEVVLESVLSREDAS